MRRDLRPYFIRRILNGWNRFYVKRFIEPAFDALGPHPDITSPRNVEIWGGGITAGANLHLHASRGSLVRLATWRTGEREGRIEIGDHVLISPGTHIVSSERIVIGSNTMIASNCYISDSDWHDTYDRTAELEKHRPIHIGENVWLGVRVIIGKGVTIGKNSIVGAGAVVMSDIPANCIAAGNPARVVRELDPAREFRTRSALFADPDKLEQDMDRLMRYMLRENTLGGWLRSLLSPSRLD